MSRQAKILKSAYILTGGAMILGALYAALPDKSMFLPGVGLGALTIFGVFILVAGLVYHD